MKTFKKYLIPFLIFLALVLGFWNLKQNNQNTPIPNTKVVRDFKANLTINNGVDTVTSDASQYIGKTALDLTLDATSGKVEMTGTGKNAFITSINGRVADNNKREFWELFVNGLSSNVGAGTYIVKEGDQIEWHINKY